MSITTALSSALSGLTVTSRGVETAANNIANALTEGFARRELEVSARAYGGEGQGVRVVGVNRIIDMTLVGDRRLADAAAGDRNTRSAFYESIAKVVGDTADGSLLSRITGLSAALASAASRPESTVRLQDVLDTAQALVSGLNAASDAVLTARRGADASIADQVDQLNAGLESVRDLNLRITRLRVTGRDSSALEDERQRVVDSMATIVPLREIERENGQIALFTTGGAALLDGRVAEIGFTPTPGLVSASSSLGSLTMDGRPISVPGDPGLMAGGSLSAAFAVRDTLAPNEQQRLDALARDLIERFTAADSSLSAGDAGLFTDEGLAFDAANASGLAGRISVNGKVDPERGGALRYLRDGLQSAAGSTGDGTLFNAMSAALDRRVPCSAADIEGSFSLAGLATEIVSGLSSSLLSADQEASFASARRDELQVLVLGDGVDTDKELEQLLLLERAYAANAKVVTACDALLQYLLEM